VFQQLIPWVICSENERNLPYVAITPKVGPRLTG